MYGHSVTVGNISTIACASSLSSSTTLNNVAAPDGPNNVCVVCKNKHLIFMRPKFKLPERAEMQMIRWMCGISMKDRRTNEKLRRLVGVEPITTVIRSGRLRWYGHVMRKSDEDWVKKCMEFRVEGRRRVGRPKKDMVRECRYGYGRTWNRQRRCPWQKELEKECYEEGIQTYRKTDYKPIIIITWILVHCTYYLVIIICRSIFLEYFIQLLSWRTWSPHASSTSINKLQVMQNAALRTATGCTRDTNIQHLHDKNTHTSHIRAPTVTRVTIQTNTQHPSHPLHKHTTYSNTKKHYI